MNDSLTFDTCVGSRGKVDLFAIVVYCNTKASLKWFSFPPKSDATLLLISKGEIKGILLPL